MDFIFAALLRSDQTGTLSIPQYGIVCRKHSFLGDAMRWVAMREIMQNGGCEFLLWKLIFILIRSSSWDLNTLASRSN